MVVRISVVYAHVLKERLDVSFEESLDLSVVVFRVDKDGADVRFDNVG